MKGSNSYPKLLVDNRAVKKKKKAISFTNQIMMPLAWVQSYFKWINFNHFKETNYKKLVTLFSFLHMRGAQWLVINYHIPRSWSFCRIIIPLRKCSACHKTPQSCTNDYKHIWASCYTREHGTGITQERKKKPPMGIIAESEPPQSITSCKFIELGARH
jgi:hypothetical protein